MNHSFIDSGGSASPRGPRRAPGRAERIAAAGCRVFTRQGWRLAQVADVAREAGVAAGTVYLYAADKEALLTLAIRAAARLPMPAEGALPARPALREALAEALSGFRLPALEALLAGGAAGPGTLATLLAELHDLMARERRLILLLDRLSAELPEVAAAWGETVRAGALRAFTQGIGLLARQGLARADLDPEAAPRAVMEMLAWMAMRRAADPRPPACDEAAARVAALALAEAALTPQPGGQGYRENY
jgi:AcrR family transcriptional regulator